MFTARFKYELGRGRLELDPNGTFCTEYDGWRFKFAVSDHYPFDAPTMMYQRIEPLGGVGADWELYECHHLGARFVADGMAAVAAEVAPELTRLWVDQVREVADRFYDQGIGEMDPTLAELCFDSARAINAALDEVLAAPPPLRSAGAAPAKA
jgi:hypothetical protein